MESRSVPVAFKQKRADMRAFSFFLPGGDRADNPRSGTRFQYRLVSSQLNRSVGLYLDITYRILAISSVIALASTLPASPC